MKDWPIFDITLGTFKTNFDNIYTLETGLQTYFCFRQKIQDYFILQRGLYSQKLVHKHVFNPNTDLIYDIHHCYLLFVY